MLVKLDHFPVVPGVNIKKMCETANCLAIVIFRVNAGEPVDCLLSYLDPPFVSILFHQ